MTLSDLADAYTTGLHHTLTATAWTLGALTIAAPWAAGAVLLRRTAHALSHTRPKLWLRARASARRLRRAPA